MGATPSTWDVVSRGLPCRPGQFSGTPGAARCTMCPAGTYSPTSRFHMCLPCAVGRFTEVEGSTTCTPCPPGTYGNQTGLSTPACSGACVAAIGSACGAGVVSSTGSPCTPGRFGLGVTLCTNCAAGKFGASPSLSSALCSGVCSPGQYSTPASTACSPCRGGFYGNSFGLTTSTCTGACAAGSVCPPGSATNTTLCPSGTFSVPAAAMCTDCAAGRYGTSVGSSNASCDGNCTAGFACPLRSTSPRPVSGLCPAGRFSMVGAGQCSACSAGYACPPGSASPSPASSVCSAGRYSWSGAEVCSDCAPGFACPLPAAVIPTVAECPAGRWSLGGAVACSACMAGRFGATPRMNVTGCTGDCTAGFACPPGATNATHQQCGPGQYSLGGQEMCSNCTSGRYGASSGLSSALCSGPCQKGAYCPSGSRDAASVTCPPGFECPQGSSLPVQCSPGMFSEPGASVCSMCAGGTFGSSLGLQTSSCSGACAAGYYCPPGSTNATAILCPMGSYCAPGSSAPLPCGGGVLANAVALTSFRCNGACPTGYYCPGMCVAVVCAVGLSANVQRG